MAGRARKPAIPTTGSVALEQLGFAEVKGMFILCSYNTAGYQSKTFVRGFAGTGALCLPPVGGASQSANPLFWTEAHAIPGQSPRPACLRDDGVE